MLQPESEMDPEGLKADIISADISVIIRAKLKNALTDNFNFVKKRAERSQV